MAGGGGRHQDGQGGGGGCMWLGEGVDTTMVKGRGIMQLTLRWSSSEYGEHRLGGLPKCCAC